MHKERVLFSHMAPTGTMHGQGEGESDSLAWFEVICTVVSLVWVVINVVPLLSVWLARFRARFLRIGMLWTRLCRTCPPLPRDLEIALVCAHQLRNMQTASGEKCSATRIHLKILVIKIET